MPKTAEEMKAYKAAYYVIHRDRLRKKQAEYSAAHKKEIRERNVATYWADPKKAHESVNSWRRKIKASIAPEVVAEQYLRERVEALGGICPKFVDPSRRGAPDRLVVLPGRPIYFVEMKRYRLGKISSWQERYHADLRACGHKVWVLWSKEEVDGFFAEI
jgi:hypothetical protein